MRMSARRNITGHAFSCGLLASQSAFKYVARERLDSRKIAPYSRLIDAALRDFRHALADFANSLDFNRASVE
jgi:hypothetical protein